MYIKSFNSILVLDEDQKNKSPDWKKSKRRLNRNLDSTPTLKSTLSHLHMWVRRFLSWEPPRSRGAWAWLLKICRAGLVLVDERGPLCVDAMLIWVFQKVLNRLEAKSTPLLRSSSAPNSDSGAINKAPKQPVHSLFVALKAYM